MRPHEMPRDGELAMFTRKVAIVVACATLLGLLWLVRNILFLVFIAAVLAAGISPAVLRVRILWRYWFRRHLRRGTAVMIVYLPFVIAVLLLALVVMPRLVVDMRALGHQLPALIDQNILTPLDRYVPVGVLRDELRGGIDLPRSSFFVAMRGAATVIGSIIAILFMVAYMLIDAERLRNLLLLVYSPAVRGQRRRALYRVGRRMSSWMSAQLLLSAIIGTATFIGLLLLRIPYALPLAILAAVGEMVPVIGPTLGAIPALAIAMLQSPWQFWAVLAFAVILQKVENLFIVPRVMSAKLQISPLAVFIAFMMGASLLGIVGAIMAIPVAAIVQVSFGEAFVARRERRQDVERAGTLLRRE